MKHRDIAAAVSCTIVVAAVLAIPAVAQGSAPLLGPAGDIAFVSNADGDEEIYLIDADGGAPVNLTDHPANDSEPVWSPDGRDLAFISDRDGGPARYVLSTGQMVTSDADAEMSWSPDGRYIAWVSHDGFNDLWVTDVATGVPTNITGGSLAAWDPAWGPDSRTIFFTSAADGGPRMVMSVLADGGTPTELAPGDHFAVSPDGTRLAVGGNGTLTIMDVDGTDASLLVTAAEFYVFEWPAWSPDGSSIAYGYRRVQGSPVLHTARTYVVPASGGAAIDLGLGTRPQWSPDGGHVLISWFDILHSSALLAIATADGTSYVELSTPDQAAISSHSGSWSPDGEFVAFAGYMGSSVPPPPTSTYVVRADGIGAVAIASGGGPAWRPAPYHVGLVDPATGVWHLNGIAPFYYGDPGDVPFLGDCDADGIATPGLYRQSDGYVYLRNSNTQGVADIRFFFGNPGDVPLAGDFDGDGLDTVSIYRPGTGEVFIIDELGAGDAGLGAADRSYYFGDPGDAPFVGDFDGDGVDTVGLHRESTGFAYLRNSHTPGFADAAFYFGDPGDRLLACDWDDDGADSVGIYRPETTTFHLRFTNTPGGADARFVMGRPAWLPVCGVLEG